MKNQEKAECSDSGGTNGDDTDYQPGDTTSQVILPAR